MNLFQAIKYIHDNQGQVIEVVHNGDAVEIADMNKVLMYGAALSRIPSWVAYILYAVGYFKI